MANTLIDHPLIFHSGITSFNPQRQAFHKKHYPETAMFDKGVFCFDGVEASYYIHRARNEKALIIGSAGAHTENLLNPSEMHRLNQVGISAVYMTLRENMDDNLDMMREFFTNKSSPAFIHFPTSSVRYAATYSTSGLLFMELMHQEKTRRKLTAGLSGAAYVSPCFDIAGASQYNRIGSQLFNWYANKHKDERPHETSLGKAYIKFKATQEKFKDTFHEISPTYREILDIQSRGQSLRYRFNAEAANALPSIFMFGDKDPFACSRTTMGYVREMGLTPMIARGAGHDPIKQQPEQLERLISVVEDCAARRETALSNTYWINSQERPLVEDLPEWREPLRDRAGFALQRAASLLYPAASLF